MSGSAGSTQIRNDGDGGCNDDDSGDGSCDDDDGDDSGCDENDNAVMQVAAVLSSSVLRHQQHQYTLIIRAVVLWLILHLLVIQSYTGCLISMRGMVVIIV